MRISDWSSAVCSSDLLEAIVALPSRMVEDGFCGRMIGGDGLPGNTARVQGRIMAAMARIDDDPDRIAAVDDIHAVERQSRIHTLGAADADGRHAVIGEHERSQPARIAKVDGAEVVDRKS